VHVSADIGCHSFATLAPFHMGASIMGYGLGPASGSALSGGQGVSARYRSWGRRFLAQRPDQRY